MKNLVSYIGYVTNLTLLEEEQKNKKAGFSTRIFVSII